MNTAGGAYVKGDVRAQTFVGRGFIQLVVQPVRQTRQLSFDYATRIANFLHEYLVTAEEKVPFGGREAELTRLDRWLADPAAPPRLLVAAEAGRGKTALLARWAARLRARGDLHVVFVPVSIRFNTAAENVVFSALVAQLGAVYSEAINWESVRAADLRGLAESLLRRTPPHGKALIVILDALDEASDWQPDVNLVPRVLPAGVRLVASARYLAGDREILVAREEADTRGAAIQEFFDVVYDIVACKMGLERRQHYTALNDAAVFELTLTGNTIPGIARELGCAERLAEQRVCYARARLGAFLAEQGLDTVAGWYTGVTAGEVALTDVRAQQGFIARYVAEREAVQGLAAEAGPARRKREQWKRDARRRWARQGREVVQGVSVAAAR